MIDRTSVVSSARHASKMFLSGGGVGGRDSSTPTLPHYDVALSDQCRRTSSGDACSSSQHSRPTAPHPFSDDDDRSSVAPSPGAMMMRGRGRDGNTSIDSSEASPEGEQLRRSLLDFHRCSGGAGVGHHGSHHPHDDDDRSHDVSEISGLDAGDFSLERDDDDDDAALSAGKIAPPGLTAHASSSATITASPQPKTAAATADAKSNATTVVANPLACRSATPQVRDIPETERVAPRKGGGCC